MWYVWLLVGVSCQVAGAVLLAHSAFMRPPPRPVWLVPLDHFWIGQFYRLFDFVGSEYGELPPVLADARLREDPDLSGRYVLSAHFPGLPACHVTVDGSTYGAGFWPPPPANYEWGFDASALYEQWRAERVVATQIDVGWPVSVFDRVFRSVQDTDANEKGWQLLRENLRPHQRSEFDAHGMFTVIGSATGRKYQITSLPFFNVIAFDGKDRPVEQICFAPGEPLVQGDIMLAQKIGLECDELEALRVANRRPIFPGEVVPVIPYSMAISPQHDNTT